MHVTLVLFFFWFQAHVNYVNGCAEGGKNVFDCEIRYDSLRCKREQEQIGRFLIISFDIYSFCPIQ